MIDICHIAMCLSYVDKEPIISDRSKNVHNYTALNTTNWPKAKTYRVLVITSNTLFVK